MHFPFMKLNLPEKLIRFTPYFKLFVRGRIDEIGLLAEIFHENNLVYCRRLTAPDAEEF